MPSFNHVVVAADPGGTTLEKTLADINGDGKLDAVIGTGGNGLYWWSFPASGNVNDPWIKHTIRTSGYFYEDVKAIDLNNDGHLDLIASVDNAVKWFQNPGGTGDGDWKEYPIADGVGHDMVLADFDGDGKMDLAASRNHLIMFQNSPTAWTSVSFGSRLDGLALLATTPNKPAIDLVGAKDTGLVLFANPRDHGGDARKDPWEEHVIGPKYGENDAGPCLAAADLNGDGRMDMISAPNEGNPDPNLGLIWWEAPQDPLQGQWTKHTIDGSYVSVHRIIPAYMNDDRKIDLVLAEQEQSPQDRIAVFFNDGSGNFTQDVLAKTGGHDVYVADVDGDGDQDILNANHGVYGAPHPIELFVNQMR